MKHKTTVLIGMILTVAVFQAFCQSTPGSKSKSKTPSSTEQNANLPAAVKDAASKSEARKLIVYYFMTTARCPTCFKLEGYAKSEVEADFADEIRNGKLEWKSVNVDEKDNEHFANDYKLYTKSVVISIVQDGKEASWKNLDQIWQLVHNEPAYREYIKNEVTACLAGKCL